LLLAGSQELQIMLWPLEQLLQPVVFLFFFASLVDNLSLALGGFWVLGWLLVLFFGFNN